MQRHQLLNLIIIPTLKEIPNGYSKEAATAIQMIIAHESQNGKYIKQLGGGPALGIIQMEPATHDDVWKHGDSVWRNALQLSIITKEEKESGIHPKAERLLYDLQYNVFMARQRLFMKPEALPTSMRAISAYLKTHWNTAAGSATDKSYLTALFGWS